MLFINPVKNYVEIGHIGTVSGGITDPGAFTDPGADYVVGVQTSTADTLTDPSTWTIDAVSATPLVNIQNGTSAAKWAEVTYVCDFARKNGATVTFDSNGAATGVTVWNAYGLWNASEATPTTASFTGDGGSTTINLVAGGVLLGAMAGRQAASGAVVPAFIGSRPATLDSTAATANARSVGSETLVAKETGVSVGHTGNGTFTAPERLAGAFVCIKPKWMI